MALLDQWGNAFRYKAAAGAERFSRDRPWEPVQLKDITKLIPPVERETLYSASRRLFINLGVARGAIEQKAMYAVGRAWSAQFTGADNDFGTVAQDWLNNQWYGIGNVKGGQHDFKTSLFLISVAIDRDGECFILLTQSEDGYPRFQFIPGHQIATPANIEEGARLGAGTITDGIVYNSQGTPVQYCLVDSNKQQLELINASSMIHCFDPSWQEQGRGLPAFTHAINDLRDMRQSHEWERRAQLMLSSIGIIETTETGAPDFDDPAFETQEITGTSVGLTLETLEGGMIRHLKAGTGSKIETIKSDRPGEPWENFHDRIIRSALSGINWPYSMAWKATGQGTAERSDLGKAQRAVEDRQDVIHYAAFRLVGYAVAKRQKMGDLPESADWWRWKFNHPRKLTIDDGRVNKELLELWRAGKLNDDSFLAALGEEEPQAHYRMRAKLAAQREIARVEAEKEYGVTIDPREMSMFTPNDQPLQNDETPAN